MSSHSVMRPLRALKSPSLRGTAQIPGDKSISHRSLIFGAMSIGETTVSGLLEGQDVLDTARAMRSFGAQVERDEKGMWHINGLGVGGFLEPDHVIDCGNSGTGVRLIMGAMATTAIAATFTGDASLNKRPMGRVTDPLALFGARSYGRSRGRLPLTLIGAERPVAVHYETPVPSAQVKSAVLLAGLAAQGETTVIEKEATRDHTERMLAAFGAQIDVEHTNEGHQITLQGLPDLRPQHIDVPRDPSSAAFVVCAALLIEGSDVLLPNIALNPTRTGLFTTLREMGADLTFENERQEGGEPVADLRARFSPNLKGVSVPPHRAASMIDEYPMLSVVAAFAEGVTEMRGVKELRVKESDRIDAMAKGLRSAGVTVDEGPDWWIVHGRGHGAIQGVSDPIATHLDHRIAMSFLVMGMASQTQVAIDSAGAIATSFPNFETLMHDLGAVIEEIEV